MRELKLCYNKYPVLSLNLFFFPVIFSQIKKVKAFLKNLSFRRRKKNFKEKKLWGDNILKNYGALLRKIKSKTSRLTRVSFIRHDCD